MKFWISLKVTSALVEKTFIMDIHSSHGQLEEFCVRKLEQSGCQVLKAVTYHAACSCGAPILPLSQKEILRADRSPTSVALRTTSDRVAIDPLGEAFTVEFKSGDGRHRNAAIEMLPFAKHILEASLGIRCMYIYRDLYNKDIGIRSFFCDGAPTPTRVVIPRQHLTDDQVARYGANAKLIWGDIDVVELDRVAGSGDPFVIFTDLQLKNLPRPSQLIASLA
jgi:hypothetical protein